MTVIFRKIYANTSHTANFFVYQQSLKIETLFKEVSNTARFLTLTSSPAFSKEGRLYAGVGRPANLTVSEIRSIGFRLKNALFSYRPLFNPTI